MAGGEDDSAERAGVRDAFSLLAHDIRLDIVLALLEEWAAVYTEPQSYSELMAAVEIEDSGKFNYHLDKLRGVYVVEVEDGYVPTASATALYRAVLAHRPTEAANSTERERPCPHCGGTLVERYERSFFTVECDGCENWSLMTYSFPQNGLRGRGAEQRHRAVEQRASYHVGLARTGQCPFCAGRVAIEFDPDWVEDDAPSVEMSCGTCTWTVGIDVLTPLRFDPQVGGALHRIGVTDPIVDSRSLGSLTARVRSEDPFRLAVDVETADGEATIVVDDDLDVHSVTVDST